MPTKHALIIGINKYQFMEQKYQLGGCVNDAKLIRDTLINKFNFDPVNMVSLHDEAATRDAILAEMDRLAEVVEFDDIVVFHYSGHGHRCKVKTEFTDEGSGKDNCILLTDDAEPSADGAIYRDIRDHQINAWLQRIADKTRYTTLIFDACHSGTITRSSGVSTRVRSVPTEARPQPVESARSAPGIGNRQSGGEKPGAGGWLSLSENYVVISGCRDTQTSKEKFFGEGEQRFKHGVLTFNLIRAIQGAKPGTTYRDVFESTCSGVVADVDAQNPQVEGAIDRELFGVKDIEPLRFIPLTVVDGENLTLGGGAAHGLRKGSRWEVYPPGTKQADNTGHLAVVEISQVGVLSSKAVIVEATGALVTGARCVESEPAEAADSLSIDVQDLGEQDREILAKGIRRSKLLSVARTRDAADIHARIVESEDSAGPAWAFFENDDSLCMPLHPVNEPGVGKLLLENLEKIARFRHVLRLDNPHTKLNVEFNLHKRTPDGEAVLANGGTTEFREDEGMILEITNREKDRAVFFRIIWISANKEIMQFYPPRKSCEELSPGKTVSIGHGDRMLTASLGDDYLADAGSETCKVIFSTTESDFSWLLQESVRSTQAPPREDWDAVNRSFILTRTPS